MYVILRRQPKDRRSQILRFACLLAGVLRMTLFTFGLLAIILKPCAMAAEERVRIVTTTSTLASMTRELMGDQADIHYVASPVQNIHFIQPTPKDVLKIRKAKAFIHQGLDLEAWRDPLLVAAGNPLFLGEEKASIDASQDVPLIEIPTSLSRVEGDIHLYGNPHYAIDPENAKIMMKNVAEGLVRIFPDRANELKAKADAWSATLDQKMKEWSGRMTPFKGTSAVTYHRSWPYFTNRFGLVVVGEIEPKPGIPPTPKHVSNLIQLMKEKNVKIIIKESFNESQTPKKLAEASGAHVLNLTQDVGGTKEAADYFSMMDDNIRQIEEAMGKSKGN